MGSVNDATRKTSLHALTNALKRFERILPQHAFDDIEIKAMGLETNLL